jgi:hypothetical protein
MGRKKGGKNKVQQLTGDGAIQQPINEPQQNPLTSNGIDSKIEQETPTPSPIVIEQTQAEVQKLVEQHQEATAQPDQPKQKRGRKPKIVDDKEQKLTEIEKGIEPLTGIMLRALNNLYPSPQEVSEDEVKAVNNGLALVMEKYMPSFDNYVPEFMLLGSIALFSLPRMKPKVTLRKIEVPAETKNNEQMENEHLI